MYILVSLFFVIATMFEFAIVLIMKRRSPHKFGTITKALPMPYLKSPCNIVKSGSTEVFKIKSLENQLSLDLHPKDDERKSNYHSRFKDITEKIDFVSLLSFMIGYFMFNIFYLAKYST